MIDRLIGYPDAPAHHAVNTAAILIPMLSVFLHGPEILSYVTAALGAIWYVMLIGERIASWFRRRDKK